MARSRAARAQGDDPGLPPRRELDGEPTAGTQRRRQPLECPADGPGGAGPTLGPVLGREATQQLAGRARPDAALADEGEHRIRAGVAVEHGSPQGAAVYWVFAEENGWIQTRNHCDLAGLDRFVTAALSRNLPLTLVNHADGPHAFDLLHDSARTREIVGQVIAFLRFHLLTAGAGV